MFRDNAEAYEKADAILKEDEEFCPVYPSLAYRDTDEVVTLENMRQALRTVLGGKGISGPDTDKLADYLMNFFGFEDYIIDNVLDAEDRDVFYTLEEESILRTEREEIYLLKGKMWRIHYWILRKRDILSFARGKVEAPQKIEETYTSIYNQVGAEVWASRSSENGF